MNSVANAKPAKPSKPAAVPAKDTANDAVDALIKSIRIPPRPTLLTDVQRELAGGEPDPRRIAHIIVNDPGMSGALLKLANSPFYGLTRKANSVEQAIVVLGITQCTALLTGLLAREAIRAEGPGLAQFWETSTKRSQAMVYLARKLRLCPPDVAHTFGLFCDIGVPLLMERFGDYQQTFANASHDAARRFTDIEDAAHSTNHAAIGCILTRNWGLSEPVWASILLHHDYHAIADEVNHPLVRSLVAAGVCAERAIQKYRGNSDSAEWAKGGELACQYLMLPEDDMDDLFDELHEMFAHGH